MRGGAFTSISKRSEEFLLFLSYIEPYLCFNYYLYLCWVSVLNDVL